MIRNHGIVPKPSRSKEEYYRAHRKSESKRLFIGSGSLCSFYHRNNCRNFYTGNVMQTNEIEREIKSNQETLKRLQKQQAGLEGELKQVNSQIKSFGLEEDTDVDAYLSSLESKTKELGETLEDLLDEVQTLLDQIEGVDNESN